jgi:DnaK suppressor protein
MSYEQLRAQLQEALAVQQSRMQRIRSDVTQEHSEDSAEQAQERENDEVIDAIGNETALSVRQIRDALDRLDAGTYGACERCGEDIGLPRLQVVPQASHCLCCAE